MGSVYDIAFSFIEKHTTTQQLFNEVVESFNKVLDNGWTEIEIYKVLGNKTFDTNKTPIISLFNHKHEAINLIKSNTFYYHNILRCMAKPPRQEWDMNSGVITDIIDPYFLEMKASFTMYELVNYYYNQMDLVFDKTSYNRFKGAFEFLINKFGVDLVLFMIDAARDTIVSEDMTKPKTPVSIAEYEHDARERLNQKTSETRCTGDDKIVIRDRVFSNRNGLQNTDRVQTEYYNYA